MFSILACEAEWVRKRLQANVENICMLIPLSNWWILITLLYRGKGDLNSRWAKGRAQCILTFCETKEKFFLSVLGELYVFYSLVLEICGLVGMMKECPR